MPIIRRFIVTILCVSFLLGTRSEASDSDGITVLSDLAFLDEGREEKLDLYLPKADGENPGRRPAVIFIHGGSFVGGDKAQKGAVYNCERLAEQGFVVASINYVLAKNGPTWPQPLLDAKNSVRFLRANADKYGIDPNRISVMGSSAGGQLALLTAFTKGVEKFEPQSPWPGVSSEVNAVVNFYGGTNYLTRKASDEEGRPTDKSPYINKPPRLVGENREHWVEASPMTHVKKDNPPVLTVHGKKDVTVNYLQAVELAEALDKAGVPNKLILLEDAPHSFSLKTRKDGDSEVDLLSIVTSFLREAPASK